MRVIVSFGERLRRLREAAGLTQKELAERAGVTPDAVGVFERGARASPTPTARASTPTFSRGDHHGCERWACPHAQEEEQHGRQHGQGVGQQAKAAPRE